MLRKTSLLTACAVAAMALPVFAAEPATTLPTQEQVQARTGNETRDVGTVKKKSAEQKAKEAADKEKKRAEATKPATTRQEKALEMTAKDTRELPPVPKMTKEEKAADKALKRKPPTTEELEKARKASPG